MAQASKRATAAVMYDDEPSSMSLELFGYHGVVMDGDHDVDAGAALHGGLQLAFDDNFKAGGCGPADYYSWTGYGGGGSGASSSSSSSVLSFEQAGSGGRHQLAYSTTGGDEDCAMWMDAAAGMVDHTANCNFGFVSPGGSADHHAGREIQEPAKATQKRARPVITSVQVRYDTCMDITVGEVQVAGGKKQCSGSRKSKAKTAAPAPTKDPQSVAAKVRRERIAEKLKILQDLVPNGTKVDLVTMLEKAITYVKFLQLQVKVLAADEFWPAQGGKAPELSQVKDALDAILSSQYSNK
ncbi:hypothetical protein PR202_ga23720 [Eleusine coracana subsp. coracana]|uniref:BHLH domain-containing protein n=1 Tax=Eleusine coracana subsp. coracana TaxID=191504 RepID=A0AAV5D6K8_ELECO|nr:hypothetical protein QOZ80_1AG0006930 [Eleusine coracana subsp. coracana]GJN06035.1 hypothetical protein PR202_ga23720 [Eleusine coracana subsp. coracana]